MKIARENRCGQSQDMSRNLTSSVVEPTTGKYRGGAGKGQAELHASRTPLPGAAKADSMAVSRRFLSLLHAAEAVGDVFDDAAGGVDQVSDDAGEDHLKAGEQEDGREDKRLDMLIVLIREEEEVQKAQADEKPAAKATSPQAANIFIA